MNITHSAGAFVPGDNHEPVADSLIQLNKSDVLRQALLALAERETDALEEKFELDDLDSRFKVGVKLLRAQYSAIKSAYHDSKRFLSLTPEEMAQKTLILQRGKQRRSTRNILQLLRNSGLNLLSASSSKPRICCRFSTNCCTNQVTYVMRTLQPRYFLLTVLDCFRRQACFVFTDRVVVESLMVF